MAWDFRLKLYFGQNIRFFENVSFKFNLFFTDRGFSPRHSQACARLIF